MIVVGNKGRPTTAARATKSKYGKAQINTIGIIRRIASRNPNDKMSTARTGTSKFIKSQQISIPQITAIQMPTVRIFPIGQSAQALQKRT